MGAVCKICGNDMMKAKGCSIAKIHVGVRYMTASRWVLPGISTKECLIRPDAMTVTCFSGICTIGDAMLSVARHAVVSCGCEDVYIEG